MKQFFELIRDRLTGKAPIGTKRSKEWPKVRKEFLKENPVCALCGGTSKLQVHHKLAFWAFPDLELDKDNLITLCDKGKFGIKSCHLLFGHLGNYKKINLNVESDAAEWSIRLRNNLNFMIIEKEEDA